MVILLFPPPHAQYSIPDRRKRWKCVFGLLSLTFRMYVGMKPGWFMADDQAILETEDFEPLTLPKVEDKDPSFRNWERSQIQRFCGRNWPMGTVSGATRLADFFLQFRCWEFSPWIFSPGSRQPCWACVFPYCWTARHQSLWAVCEQCLSYTEMTEICHLGFGSFL